ncbi:polyprenyl synthetase family protein [Halorutilales archaeon Cl-col2-1]
MENRFTDRVEAVNDEIDTVASEITPEPLSDAVRHISLSGGKRLRPILTTVACEAVGGDPLDSDAVRHATAVELVHTSALVADDIIDRSEIRRGVSSVHEKYGHPMAVLSSNVLIGEAFDLIESSEAAEVMTDALVRLGEGEALELTEGLETVDDYFDLAYKKTGSLFLAACKLGAVSGDASQEEIRSVGEYGRNMGIAFQIRDDILDFTSNPGDLGKPVGEDALMERPSLVVIHSKANDVTVEESIGFARERAMSYVEDARSSLDTLDEDATESLEEIADFVVERTK